MNTTVDMVTISSRGQIVIPKKILKSVGLNEQDKLLVYSKGDNILLKKIEPEMFEKSLREILVPVRQDMEAKGLTEKDVETEIKAHRTEKSKA
ncbi:MAG: AbrB/MazE/SpoVT family DNA-binding domain-containing protein [Candidatus Methanoperedens sp.]|jgi:AbrB family looped-hinge helix DNA binding protein|nr:AbrB/MazE/SpoVT family DNA-binding domain-containing protein [Candidatus Methanoperedens sp.]PKL52964.1 MAG: hypothetical protein CVV36_09595 [Candidatus Methanoperedenaceae archaeon HGW-Methanoperedenaceae-1]